jgi:ADP-heptose:LPS heptosyltransferase
VSGLDAVRSVLVLRTDRVGDLILSTPAIRCLREALPDARISLLATPYNAPVVDGSPRVDEVLLLDPRWSLARKIRFARHLRSRRFDIAVVLSPRTPAYLLAWVSGAPIRAGIVYPSRIFARALSPLMLTRAHVPDLCEAIHEVTQMLDLLRELGLPVTEHPLEVWPSSDDHGWASGRLGDARPLIGLHLAGKWVSDGWEAADLLGLMRAILAGVPDSRILASYGVHDRSIAGPVSDRIQDERIGERITLVGDATFGRWAAAFARCDVIVSPDTGSLHLAAAVGRPIVALYSARTFEHCSVQWAPWMVPNRIMPLDSADKAVPGIVDSIRGLLVTPCL